MTPEHGLLLIVPFPCSLVPPTTILTQICRVECCPGVNGWEVGEWVLHVQYLWKDLQQQVQVNAAC